MMLYDVRVLNEQGVWQTDTVTSSEHRAQERAKYLHGQVPHVLVEDNTGRRLQLEGA